MFCKKSAIFYLLFVISNISHSLRKLTTYRKRLTRECEIFGLDDAALGSAAEQRNDNRRANNIEQS